jgi:NDP-sugar pyrophosphorylase family protein
MKAMILAAGLGSRLRPLTDDRPKALVEVSGRTLLEIALTRLRAFGIKDVIINVHHFAQMIEDYLAANGNFGMNVRISREEVLLDTGGGLKQAAYFFREDPSAFAEPFFLHNVDVISTIDFRRMLDFHEDSHALATLAVQPRSSSRQLLFDEDGRLYGRQIRESREITHKSTRIEPFAFCGVHVISAGFLNLLVEEGTFSIIDSYLRLAAAGMAILGFRADEYFWRDLGTPQNILQTAKDFENGIITF